MTSDNDSTLRGTSRCSSRVTKSRKPAPTMVGRRSLRLVIRESILDARAHAESLAAAEGLVSPVLPATPPVRKQKTRSSRDLPTPPATPTVDLSNGVPTPRKGWYYIKSIVTEVGTGDNIQYLVEWEGEDPKTGNPWPDTWVKKREVSASAVRVWEEKKATMAEATMTEEA